MPSATAATPGVLAPRSPPASVLTAPADGSRPAFQLDPITLIVSTPSVTRWGAARSHPEPSANVAPFAVRAERDPGEQMIEDSRAEEAKRDRCRYRRLAAPPINAPAAGLKARAQA